jgi:hypothetical protein
MFGVGYEGERGTGQCSSPVVRFSVPQLTELVVIVLIKLSMRNELHLCDVFLSPGPLKLVQRSSSLDARFLLIADITCNIFAPVYPARSPSLVLTGGRLCLLCWLS